jgi:hypothetical protein
MQRSRFLAFLAVALTIVLALTGVSGFILETLAARHLWPEFSLGTSAHQWHFVFGSVVFAAIGVIGAFLAESRIFG